MNTESKRPKLKNAGIAPATLNAWVMSSCPYLFNKSELLEKSNSPEFRYLDRLWKLHEEPPLDTDLWDYYELCLLSHFVSVGSFVPTDVDLQIRLKLWQNVHHEDALLPLWNLIQEMYKWDESLVSNRFVVSGSGLKLSGHQGEWFTVAMGAYLTAKQKAPELLPEIREAIEAEVQNQKVSMKALHDEFLEKDDAVSVKRFLSGVAALAHNLGDLDRMFELGAVDDHDVLKRRVFRLGHEDARAPDPFLIKIGNLYQSLIANENHRNFALREPKGIRKSREFLLPFGLFLDDWGAGLIENGFKAGVLTEQDIREVIEALVFGWKKLNVKSLYHSQGYSRALVGVARALGGSDGYQKGRARLIDFVPPVVKKELETGGLRTLMSVETREFERKWVTKVRAFVEA